MMRFLYISFLLFVFATVAKTQVRVDQKLVMTGTDSTQRTLLGLNIVSDSLDLLSGIELGTNRLVFATTNNNDSLYANLPVFTGLQEGSMTWIINSVNTAAGLKVSTNASTYYPVMTNVYTPAQTNCIKANEMELLIYTGSTFQEMFEGYAVCPTSFIEVNEKYCIQLNENIGANYWNAIATCEAQGAKLCTWSEWYYACQNAGLGLTNATNNWEWSESANNHATSVLVLGNGTCQSAGESNTQVITTRPYRCCFRKK